MTEQSRPSVLTLGYYGLDRPTLAFFALAYGLAWGAFGLVALVATQTGGIGAGELFARIEVLDLAGLDLPIPGIALYAVTRIADFSFSIAGVVMIWHTLGRDGLEALWSRLTRFRTGIRWYVWAAIPLGLYALAAAVTAVGSDTGLRFAAVSPELLWGILFAIDGGLLVTLFLRGPLGEELGLRGFALPRLQERTNAFRASAVIGLLWGLWHLPVLLGREPLIVVVFLLLAFGLSFVFTWLFNGSGGSLVPVLLFHTFQNSEEVFERILPALVGTNWELVSTLSLLAVGIVAARAVHASSK